MDRLPFFFFFFIAAYLFLKLIAVKEWNEDKVSSRHPRSYGNENVDDEAGQSVPVTVPEQGKGQV